MIEDKLDHDERLRLECLALAASVCAMRPGNSAEQIIAHASTFEKFVRGDK